MNSKKLIILILLIVVLILPVGCSSNTKTSNLSSQSSNETSTESSSESSSESSTESSKANIKESHKVSSEKSSNETNEDATSTWTFESVDFNNNIINSKEYFAKAKLTIVNVWSTWCPHCLKELPNLGKFVNEFENKDVQFLGIATDVVENNQDIQDKANKLLTDSSITYTNIYNNFSVDKALIENNFDILPSTFIVDENGTQVVEFLESPLNFDNFQKLIDDTLTLVNTR